MYPASKAFKEAAYSSNPKEKVKMMMSGVVFDNEDMHNSSLTFTEAVNNEEELTIGGTVSSTIQLTILNNNDLLSDYDFSGQCRVYLGVKTESKESTIERPYAILNYGTTREVVIKGSIEKPYLTIDGETPSFQPPFPVHAVIVDEGAVYCVSEIGDVWSSLWVDGKTWAKLKQTVWKGLELETWESLKGHLVSLQTPDINHFMRNKFAKWAREKRGAWKRGLTTYEFVDNVDKYEYVPLGSFLPEKPKKRNVSKIQFYGTDKMTLFDADAKELLDTVSYPITTADLLSRICDYVGVSLATTNFINADRIIDENIFGEEETTLREIVSWIAESACSFARMTRDGLLELAWFSHQSTIIPMSQYFSIDVAEYYVNKVDKLQIISSQKDVGVVIGSGTNGYQIANNPILYGENDDEIRRLGVPIYNRLNALSDFYPINARAVCDWSIQAGDVITINLNGIDYALPIYRQTVTWNGGACRVVYESTGSEYRPVMNATNRKTFNQKRALHELSVTVDGISSRIVDAEDNIAILELSARELDLKIESTAEMLSTRITQTVNSITLSAQNGEETSRLTISFDGAEISSADIKFDGMVTFSGLEDGTTEINGKCIKTGKISANRIDVDDLYVQHLDAADGTFTKLTAAGGTVTFEPEMIDISGIQIGRVDYYTEICIMPTEAGTGNVGTSGHPFDQVVAENLYGTTQGGISDRRLKDNIRPYDEDVIMLLNPSRFVFKKNPDVQKIGFIANEVMEVVPEVVSELYNELTGDSIYCLDYGALTCVLTSEAQRARTRQDSIEQRVMRLEEAIVHIGG